MGSHLTFCLRKYKPLNQFNSKSTSNTNARGKLPDLLVGESISLLNNYKSTNNTSTRGKSPDLLLVESIINRKKNTYRNKQRINEI